MFLSRSSNVKAATVLSKAGIRDNSTDLFARDSNYQYVTVYEETLTNDDDDSDDADSEETPADTSTEQANNTPDESADSTSDPDRVVKVLRLDFLEHGYIDPNDPYYLNYDYEDVYSELVHRFTKEDQKQLNTFFIRGER